MKCDNCGAEMGCVIGNYWACAKCDGAVAVDCADDDEVTSVYVQWPPHTAMCSCQTCVYAEWDEVPTKVQRGGS